MLATLSTSSLGFVYWVIVAHVFRAAQVGVGTAFVALMVLTSVVSNLGTAPALVQRLPSQADIEDWSLSLSSCLVAGVVLGLVAGALVLAILPVFSHRLGVAGGDAVLAVTFVTGTGFWTVATVLDYMFLAERASRYISARGAIFAVVKIPLVMLPALALGVHASARVILISWVVACAISCLLAVTVLMPKIRPGARLRLKGVARELRQMSRLLIGNHFTTLGNNLALYLLPAIVVTRLSATENAYFYLTWMVGGIFFMISSSVGSSLFAEGSNAPGLVKAAATASTRFTFALLAPAVVVALFAGRWILALFGAAYARNGTHLLWILAAASVPDAITNLYVPFLRVRHRLRAAGLLTMGMALFAIVGAWLVAPSLKLIGIGLVWLLAQSLGGLWVLCDILRSRPTELVGAISTE